jgi:hypothetical protein
MVVGMRTDLLNDTMLRYIVLNLREYYMSFVQRAIFPKYAISQSMKKMAARLYTSSIVSTYKFVCRDHRSIKGQSALASSKLMSFAPSAHLNIEMVGERECYIDVSAGTLISLLLIRFGESYRL